MNHGKSKRAIIFIPGFKGSQLYDQHDKLIWPNVMRSQFSRRSLQYSIPDLDLYNKNIFYSSDIVRSVNLLPYLWQKDIYGNFLTNLESQIDNQTKLITFGYDWRKNLVEVTLSLNTLVNKLIAAGNKKIDVISHSMGGLIAAYLLRHGRCASVSADEEWVLSRYINKVIFVAVPFQGAIKVLRDLISGTKLGFNHSLLSAKALCTFPSIYCLLPCYENAITKSSNNVLTELSAHDPTIWDDYQFSLLNGPNASAEIRHLRQAYLKRHLILSKEFHDALHTSENSSNPPADVKIITISGTSHNTLSELQINDNGNHFIWQNQEGDGSVPLHSSSPPDRFKIFSQKNYRVGAEHTAILKSQAVQKIIYDELL